MSTRHFWILSLLAATAFLAGCASSKEVDVNARRYLSGSKVICADGGIRVSSILESVFQDKFQDDGKLWQHPVINQETRLRFERRKGTDGGLFITRRKDVDNGDTAFEMVSSPFKVKEKATFSLRIDAQSNVNLEEAASKDGYFVNVIEWLAEDGKLLDTQKFSFRNVEEDAYIAEMNATIPKKAYYGILHLGMDAPDIPENGYILISEVSILQEKSEENYWPRGSFISLPFRMPEGGTVDWDAKIPRGCGIAVQLSTAADKNGEPGVWSPFFGPEGNPRQAFLKPGQPIPEVADNQVWCRYRVTLQSDVKRTPVIYSVTVGDWTDGEWTGPVEKNEN